MMEVAAALYRSMGFRRDPDRDMPVEDYFTLSAYSLAL
jgi:hypothetical protein